MPRRRKLRALNPALLIPVRSLGLSLLVRNCLNNDGIFYVGDLVHMTAAELRQRPSLGIRRIKEIEKVLASLGLRLGMAVPGWRPEIIEKSADGRHEC
jgi:DNA-directed RNA polymerase subunit alpha